MRSRKASRWRSVAVMLPVAGYLAATAAAEAREWPSAPFRGQFKTQPACACRTTSGRPVELGQEACLATPAGAKRAKCVLVLNNTSWQIGPEDCEPELTN